MFLQIDDTMTIDEVQDRFNECFPYLQIVFYSVPHKRFQPSEKQYLLDSKSRVENIRKRHYNGSLEIKSWYTVARVEKDIKILFDLNAQIFRSNLNGQQLQTSVSDTMTLQQQSEFAYDRQLNT